VEIIGTAVAEWLAACEKVTQDRKQRVNEQKGLKLATRASLTRLGSTKKIAYLLAKP